jgi:hypothetical protein
MVQHLHFFEKNSEKYKINTKNITKNTKWWNLVLKVTYALA